MMYLSPCQMTLKNLPTYKVTVTALDNVVEVQIRVVRTFDGPEELVLTDTVSLLLTESLQCV